ncbi:MAG TPA: prenyltransferase/squalene oxidase repeat-containing protein, partial [Dehalococcoidia bacterium]|nr:prenyltransferase/squalene oxidase repeat-containing protein [Dehalococcoidia bacterium]
DFGAALDPPTEDVTAHVLEARALFGLSGEASRRALRFLLDRQEPDGAWWGRWGVNYVYGIGAVVPALVAAGMPRAAAPLKRAALWLADHQNVDGGWGETCASYRDPSLRGLGVSTASQTAWALLTLLAVRPADAPEIKRGIDYLIETQQPNGEWLEDEFTGTGFPGDFMLKYHCYRLYWPLWALGRYRRIVAGSTIHEPGSEALS